MIKKRILNFDLVFDQSGLLFIEQTKTIIISDIHLGKGTSMNKKGNYLPPYEVIETINKLKKKIEYYSPLRIISLGDSFHDKFSILNMNKSDISEIKKITSKVQFIWINGNHDQNIIGKNKVGGIFLDILKEEKIIYKHIRTNIFKKYEFEFTGHFHPKFLFKINNSSYFYKCFVLTKNFCILPSFGTYTGGLDIRNNVFKKIINDNANIIILGKNKMIQKNINYDPN